MTHIAFVTCSSRPDMTPDDGLAAAALARRGWRVSAVAWDDPRVDWESFDGLALRSTWNYHLNPAAFRDWLGRVEDLSIALCNPAEVVRWNMDKGYLLELAERGYPVVETEWLEARQPADLVGILERRGWTDAVVKPAVSASAHNTWRVTLAGAAERQANLDALLAGGAAMVQPFMAEVRAEGEWSLVFFGGQFSHAVLKRPAANDFRVQAEHGGGHEPAGAAPEMVGQAAELLAGARDGPPAYARVDGVRRGGAFTLMELELIEPYLFLQTDAEAGERFAAALVKWLDSCCSPN